MREKKQRMMLSPHNTRMTATVVGVSGEITIAEETKTAVDISEYNAKVLED